MLILASNLLLNLLAILVSLIFHQFWIESRPQSPFVKKYSVLVTTCIALILCMSFSFYIVDGIHYDLRRIPLWFGALYGGPFVGLFLCVITLVIRIIQGGPLIAQIISMLLTILFYIVTIKVTPLYFRISNKKKIILGIFLNIVFSLLFLSASAYFQENAYHIGKWSEYVIINAIGLLIVGCTIELISRNYELRLKLIQNEQLNLLSEMAAAVNHEIRNPLTSSRGIIQFLNDDLSMSEEKRKYFSKLALEEIDRAGKVAENYLTFANPYFERNSHLYMMETIKESIKAVSCLNPKVLITMQDIQDCRIRGDHNKFVQVIVNLLKNSIDAMPSGGHINISSTIAKQICHITILDNGTGMNEETVNSLGKPFFNTTSLGTGLGMMVVYRVIESMDGRIRVSSKVGEGTEVQMCLPVYDGK